MPTDAQIFADLLKLCAQSKDLSTGKQIHQRIIHSRLDRNRYLCNLLIDMYGKCGSIQGARLVFQEIDRPNPFTWNIVISANAANGHLEEARSLFDRMPKRNSVSWNTIISAYAQHGRLDDACHLFAQIPDQQRDEISWNAIVQACALNGRLDRAQELFDRMPQHSVISSTALVAAYARSGELSRARAIFDQMPDRDAVSWIAMASAYAQIGNLIEVKSLFDRSQTLHRSSQNALVLESWNALLVAYARNGHLAYAKQVFDEIPYRDIVTWNSMLQAFAEAGHVESAREIFLSMPERDVVSSTAAMVAVGQESAREIFAEMPQKNLISWNTIVTIHSRNGDVIGARSLFDRMPEHDLVSWNTMIAAYCQSGRMEDARSLLESMPVWDPVSWILMISGYGEFGDVIQAKHAFGLIPDRDSVAWSAIISAYARNGHSREALALFCRMDLEGIPPEQSSLASAIDACAALSSLALGKIIHSMAIDAGFAWDVIVASALVDLYGKCGRWETAMAIFEKMPRKNTVSWSAVLAARARSGAGGTAAAVEIFGRMALEGFGADPIAFMTALYACSHGGLLDKGLSLFASLSSDFGMDPWGAHYVCVIDLLARSGQLGRSEELIASMPFEPGIVAWSSLLGASNLQADVWRGRRAAEEVSKRSSQEP
ncbi:pentatricopeptide repeat-containing protein At4g02750-like [Selaginella moellendorffii]|uniref:pentatricopeptide repeat-containing protein At4g02750-like n=1 Tax=Selaginella moellendorffii TaxID=88036 RepID=UPI000D1CC2C7|nr:pentatricopeptide repeat-containing protein At4g02750-like [Selaginella moellendorffii]|eukprot:XP_024527871.1 pentatricopeptide repeat-containing protein At4g02750-like [Selaginella moellendorffii]